MGVGGDHPVPPRCSAASSALPTGCQEHPPSLGTVIKDVSRSCQESLGGGAEGGPPPSDPGDHHQWPTAAQRRDNLVAGSTHPGNNPPERLDVKQTEVLTHGDRVVAELPGDVGQRSRIQNPP